LLVGEQPELSGQCRCNSEQSLIRGKLAAVVLLRHLFTPGSDLTFVANTPQLQESDLT